MKRHFSKRFAPGLAARRLPGLLLCTLLATALLSGCSRQVRSGNGKVIDFVSKEPIPHAAVKLTCTVPPHGHYGRREEMLLTESAADGSYHFDPSGLQNCHFVWVRAAKAGYGLDYLTDSRMNPQSSWGQIPKFVYLIKDSDQPMVLLKHLAGLELEYMRRTPPHAGPYAPGRYKHLYMKFIASKRIATTPEMAAWVREHYCALLQAGWGVLSDQQRADMHDDDDSQIDGVRISLLPDSYEREVVPYCSG